MTSESPEGMSHPDSLKYGPQHEWSSIGDDGTVTMGITDFAQDSLGDVQFLELPSVGDTVTKGNPIAEVESAKTSSDVYAPCSGEVVEANEALVRNPEKINTAPYEAWFVRIRPSDPTELETLLGAGEYVERL